MIDSMSGGLKELARIGNYALDRRGGERCGARKIDLSLAAAHASDEISIRRRQANFAVGQNSAVAGAGAATWIREHPAAFEQRLEHAGFRSFQQNFLRSGSNDQPDVRMHPAA